MMNRSLSEAEAAIRAAVPEIETITFKPPDNFDFGVILIGFGAGRGSIMPLSKKGWNDG